VCTVAHTVGIFIQYKFVLTELFSVANASVIVVRWAKISSCSSSDRKGRALKHGSRDEARRSSSFRPTYLQNKEKLINSN